MFFFFLNMQWLLELEISIENFCFICTDIDSRK